MDKPNIGAWGGKCDHQILPRVHHAPSITFGAQPVEEGRGWTRTGVGAFVDIVAGMQVAKHWKQIYLP